MLTRPHHLLRLEGFVLFVAVLVVPGAFAFSRRLVAALVAGLVWLAHVAVDRAFGYGLKRPTGFRGTRLGPIDRGRRAVDRAGRRAGRRVLGRAGDPAEIGRNPPQRVRDGRR